MQIWAEFGKSALPICNYSQILYQFLTFTQNLKRSLKIRNFHPNFNRSEKLLSFVLFHTCVTIMFCKICLWGNCTLHRVKSVREKVCIKAK